MVNPLVRQIGLRAPLGEVLSALIHDTDLNLSVESDVDLDRPVTLARPGFDGLTLAGFINRFLVGHHRLHVAQLTASTRYPPPTS